MSTVKVAAASCWIIINNLSLVFFQCSTKTVRNRVGHNSLTKGVRLKYFGSKDTDMSTAAIHVLSTNTVTVIT